MSVQFFEKALNAFKKANKTRRQTLASQAGYESADKYQEFLENSITGSVDAKDKKVKKTLVSPTPKKKSKTPDTELTDLVIAFDTTGSMQSYISAVKNHVTTLIPNLFKQNPNLNISIVAFGDYCDMPSQGVFGNAYQCLGLTNDENNISQFVINAKGTGGGDGDEFYELVIKKITEETQWRDGSNKSVLFIADDNPHPVGYTYSGRVINNKIDWREEAKKANELGIKFDTLRINRSRTWYKELSDITNGVCLEFQSSSKTADLVEATVLARGGEATRSAFVAKSMSVEVKSDVELNAVYSMYKDVNFKK